MQHGTAALLRQGVMVFVGLAILTALEFWVAASHSATALWFLALIALAKVVVIGTYFMHAGQVFRGEEGERE
jgi:heme/copper-type cytochrome/quinol oxidase subunit 4